MLATLVLAAGCATRIIPDPVVAARQYADAVKAGDVDAVYEMLDEDAKKSITRERLGQLLNAQKQELAEQAKALQGPLVTAKTTARMRFVDGDDVVLERTDDGVFAIRSVWMMAGGALTPADALTQLRSALARRSYEGLVGVLSAHAKGNLDDGIQAVVNGLQDPTRLDIDQDDNSARVRLPTGYTVWLKREDNTWVVDDIR